MPLADGVPAGAPLTPTDRDTGAAADEATGMRASGVTGTDGADAGPVPASLVADTVNVYATPFVRPLTIPLSAGGDPITVLPTSAVAPARGVIVYDVMALPPSDWGADQATSAEAPPTSTLRSVGGPGAYAARSAKFRVPQMKFDCMTWLLAHTTSPPFGSGVAPE